MNKRLPALRIAQFKPTIPKNYDENGVRIDIVEEENGTQPPTTQNEKRSDF